MGSNKYIKGQDGGNFLLSGTTSWLLGETIKMGTTAGVAAVWNETEISKATQVYDSVSDGSGGWESGGGFDPILYVQMDADTNTPSTFEKEFSYDVTPATIVDPAGNGMAWNDSTKKIDITADGTYHVLATLRMVASLSTNAHVRLYKNTNIQNSHESFRISTNELGGLITLQGVFACLNGDEIRVTCESSSTPTIAFNSGSSIMVKRVV